MSFKSTALYAAATSCSGSNASSLALVTGGRSGIGLALAKKVASFPFIEKVFCVSRSITQEDLKDDAKLEPLAADITTAEGRQTIVEAVKSSCGGTGDDATTKQLRFLIHSAGTVEPIKSVLNLEAGDLRKAMVLNCEAPLLLTTALYPFMKPPRPDADDAIAGRVLHVSSGAAHGAPPVGWGAYGISKAAFFQSFKVLEREFRQAGGHVVVGSFKPGVVDTYVQSTIRSSSPDDMPIVQNFCNMKQKADELESSAAALPRPPPKGALDSADNVAYFAEYLLVGTSDEEFANAQNDNEYDIRDASMYERWIPSENLPPS